MASPHRVERHRPSSLLDAIDGARASFDAAGAQAGIIERDLVLAGELVRLQFAGPALIPAIEPAFAHLLANHDELSTPDLTVGVWDAVSTGVPPFPLPSGALGYGENGPRYHGERDGVVVHAGDATVSVVEPTHGKALYYVPDANDVPWYQKAAPLKDVLHAWARSHGLEFVHAAAIGHSDGGVLMAGAAGSGKSTTSLVCLRAGFCYAGDDYVLVDIERARVHSLYSSAKLEWEHLDQHPGLFRPVNSRGDPKAVGLLTSDAQGRIVRTFPLRAMMLPTITGHHETRAVETTGARALLRLAPSTVLQMPGQSQSSMQAMARLVGRVPAFRLDLGTEVSAVPQVIDSLLSDLRGP